MDFVFKSLLPRKYILYHLKGKKQTFRMFSIYSFLYLIKEICFEEIKTHFKI